VLLQAENNAEHLRFQGVSCSLVRSGTSRIIVLSGAELPRGSTREHVITSILVGENPADSLGGGHYQLNKLVVIDADRPNQFAFEFYQLDKDRQTLHRGLECANAAAGAGLVAVSNDIAWPTRSGLLWAFNRGTGQKVELSGLREASWGGAPVGVRFNFEQSHLLFSGPEPRFAESGSGSTPFWVVIRGNTFVFAMIRPDELDARSVDQLTEAGWAVAGGVGGIPKLVCYWPRERGNSTAQIDAVCYSAGEVHNSLPGSAMMNLTALLAAEHLDAEQPPGERGELTYSIAHRQGRTEVTAGWSRSGADYCVDWAGFQTPTRLLMIGQALVATAWRT